MKYNTDDSHKESIELLADSIANTALLLQSLQSLKRSLQAQPKAYHIAYLENLADSIDNALDSLYQQKQ